MVNLIMLQESWFAVSGGALTVVEDAHRCPGTLSGRAERVSPLGGRRGNAGGATGQEPFCPTEPQGLLSVPFS